MQLHLHYLTGRYVKNYDTIPQSDTILQCNLDIILLILGDVIWETKLKVCMHMQVLSSRSLYSIMESNYLPFFKSF